MTAGTPGRAARTQREDGRLPDTMRRQPAGRSRAMGSAAAVVLALFACSAVALASPSSTPILAGPTVPRIQQGYGHVRPSTVFNGGDPTGFVGKIHWTSWGGSQAVGSGISDYVGPHQSVAQGTPESVRIVAFELGVCKGRSAYDAVEWYFPQHDQHFARGGYIDACTGAYYMNGKPLVGNPNPDPAGALAAVNAYWRDVGDGNFAGAYNVVDPESDDQTEAQFAASERQDGVESARFSGRVESSSGTFATVDVVSLVVRSTQGGCQSWTGSYRMTDPLDAWLIQSADIVSQPCSS